MCLASKEKLPTMTLQILLYLKLSMSLFCFFYQQMKFEQKDLPSFERLAKI